MKKVSKGYAIAVLDKGFVYVGEVEVDAAWCVIANCRNIRKYGTERGLGEIALSGPTSATVLDDVGTVRVPLHSLVHLIDCEVDQWQ